MSFIRAVLATCGIRRPEWAYEDTQSCLLYLANFPEKVYNLRHSPARLHKGDGYCARNSHLHHAVGTLVSSVVPSPLPRLDQARHLLPLAGDADRPCQREVRTGRRKCTPAPTSDHPASTGETTCLYQDGPHAPGPASKNVTHLETSTVHRSGRRRS